MAPPTPPLAIAQLIWLVGGLDFLLMRHLINPRLVGNPNLDSWAPLFAHLLKPTLEFPA